MSVNISQVQSHFQQAYNFSKQSAQKQGKRLERKFPNYLLSLVPSVSWVPKYQPEWIIGDLIAGLTVGTMIVPQALAYSKLTGLGSEYALYTALMGGIVYTFFGTCRESSLGPTAVVCLMVGHAVSDIMEISQEHSGIEIATILCIISALLSLILGLLRLGFLMEFVSHPVILGFTTGSAFTIMLSQIPGLLGIPGIDTHQQSHLIIGSLFSSLDRINWLNLVFGLCSLAFLIILNFVSGRLNRRYSFAQYLSIGSIGITVLIFTIIAYVVKTLYPQADMNLVGKVPSGIQLTTPSSDFHFWLQVFPYAIPVTIVMLLENLAVAKTFSKRGGYSISVSQEMVALGMANLVGSFFSAFPATGALSRCAVQNKAGARTPLAGGLTGIVVILAVMVLTPEFRYVPLPTLAAVITLAAKKLIMKWSTLVALLEMDKLDFLLCLICSLTTFFGGSQLGIYVSVGLSFFILIVRIAHPQLSILFKVIGDYDHFVDRKSVSFETENPLPGVIIFRPKESLLFPNIEYFKESMMNVVLEETSSQAIPKPTKDMPWSEDLSAKGEKLRVMRSQKTGLPKVNIDDLSPLRSVVVDLTGVNRIDASGLQGLKDFKEQCAAYSGLNNGLVIQKRNDEEDTDNSVYQNFNLYFVTSNPYLIDKLQRSKLVGTVVIEADSKGILRIKGDTVHCTVGQTLESIKAQLNPFQAN